MKAKITITIIKLGEFKMEELETEVEEFISHMEQEFGSRIRIFYNEGETV